MQELTIEEELIEIFARDPTIATRRFSSAITAGAMGGSTR